MNIALSPADKKFIKVYAAEHETNVTALIAEYIDGLSNKLEE